MDFYSMPKEEDVMQVREITLKERRIRAEASEEEVQREIEEEHLKSLRAAMQEYMRSLAARHPADPAEETEPRPYQYTIF